ncbi:MAG: hypothetical protein V5A64_03155 [Candidatus Thermoplasmatota archaeon]
MVRESPEYWTSADECEHSNAVLEWWAIESFFETLENNKKWSLKAVFTEWANKSNIGSKLNFVLLDVEKNKHFVYYRKRNKKLSSQKNKLNITFGKNYFRGHYPKYGFHVIDDKNDINTFLEYTSTSYPYWVAKNITDGYLPMGLGFFKYGFIPKNKINGKIKIKNKQYSLKGVGYFEHVWGDFFYDNPLSTISSIKKSIPIYFKLGGWWLKNHRIKIPNNIKFATENNPFGYDWAWAILDNGWSIFYGNVLFWLMKGPVAGTLIVTKDGKKYKEYGNVSFQYKQTAYSKNYDFYYPTEIIISAEDKNEKLNLKFTMTKEVNEYISRFSEGKYWIALVICEALGKVEGRYLDEGKEKKLKGIAKIEPQRQVSILGHNSLEIDFKKPPNGVGFDCKLDSNFLKKNLSAKLQLAPYPSVKFNVNRKSKKE